MSRHRANRWAVWTGIPALVILAVIVFWNWNWFIPIVETRASAEIGRPVTMTHLNVQLGRVVRVIADDVTIGNPPHWSGPPFATTNKLLLQVDVWDYVFYHQLIVPSIALQDLRVSLVQEANGTSNYKLHLLSGRGANGAKIGVVNIVNGQVHALLAKLRADFTLDVATREYDSEPRIVATAHGTYNSAPIVGHMIGGGVLSLRNGKKPWPIDLQIVNGTTHVSLVGTLQQPLHLRGANIKLQFAGQDARDLTPLTGIPLPESPPYRLSGQLDFEGSHVQFRDFAGHLGKSDLEGTIDIDPGQPPLINAALRSHQVDLADLGGFIGAQPGRVSTPGQTLATRAKVAAARASPGLLPTKPISLPWLHFANARVHYLGEHILGDSIPLDNLSAVLEVTNGAVDLRPIRFGVGSGNINGDIVLTPEPNKLMYARADFHFNRVDVARLMAATHMFGGAGTVSGTASINTVGDSMATFLGNGNGDVVLGMVGGNLSALLVDLSGLEFGNALLSALGLPKRTPVQCLVDEMPLRHGVMSLDPLIVDTGEAIVRGAGSIELKGELMALQLRTAPKHLSIGSLPAPVDIDGTFKYPIIHPGAELAVRGGVAAALGAIFPPLAALPTIQLGVGDNHACDRILAEIREQPGGGNLPPPKPEVRTRATKPHP
jgi:AsmA family protein